MIAPPSQRVSELREALKKFMDDVVYPGEEQFEADLDRATSRWEVPPLMAEMKAKARKAGLWNLFLPESEYGAGLTNVEYAPLCEIMGRSFIGPEVFNCSAPDTGNMETLVRYGNADQKKRWLEPLLRGEIRSGIAMTEPDVASSDATNIKSRIERDGDDYVINGRKWWTSGAADPRCKLLIFMGKTNPNAETHLQQSMSRTARRARCQSPTFAFRLRLRRCAARTRRGEFHGCPCSDDNYCSAKAAALRSRKGRLGPGRIHHCMRAIGMAERALEAMCVRVKARSTFGQNLPSTA